MKTKRNNKKVKRNNITRQKCSIHFSKIIPETIIKLLDEKDVAFVNSLSENIHINKKPLTKTTCCFGKDFINKSCKELQKFKLIVVYPIKDSVLLSKIPIL